MSDPSNTPAPAAPSPDPFREKFINGLPTREGLSEAQIAERVAERAAQYDAAKNPAASTAAVTEAQTMRAIDALGQFGVSEGVISDLKAHGLSGVSQQEQQGARNARSNRRVSGDGGAPRLVCAGDARFEFAVLGGPASRESETDTSTFAPRAFAIFAN